VRSRISTAAIGALLVVSGAVLGTTPAQASGACSGDQRPAGATYSVNVCLQEPSPGSVVSSDVRVAATVTVTVDPGGTNPGIDSASFRLRRQGQSGRGVYVITDASGTGTPTSRTYGFLLPSYRWPDDDWALIARATMLDGFTTTTAATVNLQFNNQGVNPWAPQSFSPHEPSRQSGQPLIVTAVGDGAIDNNTAAEVSSEVNALNPDLFLYLGDVYNVGSLAEYYNWYGPRPGTPACPGPTGCGNWGQFYTITNPAAGVHEYNSPPLPDEPNVTVESGYTDYWGMPTANDNPVKHYYSFHAGGWHFISLDSTDAFRATSGWGQQYRWLKNDLANDTHACTVAYWHHPYWGMKTRDENGLTVSGGVDVRLTDLYQLLFDHGVDVLLTGHQHNFQRWRRLDPAGYVNSKYGIREIVDGAGGHPFGYFTRSDRRLASGIDRSGDAFRDGKDVGPSPNGTPAGVIKLALYRDHANYQYVLAGGAHAGESFDSTSIPCHGPPPDHNPPAAATDLRANAGTNSVRLTWTPPVDTDVAGYEIYRATGAPTDCSSSCTQVGTTNGSGTTTFTDDHVNPSTAYTYAVRARDASGNVSPLSDPVIVSTAAQLFSDDFETGPCSGPVPTGTTSWTRVSHLTLQPTTDGHGGTCEVSFVAEGKNAYAAKTLASSKSDLYTRVMFRLDSQSTSAALLKLRSASGAGLYSVAVAPDGNLKGRNEVTNRTTRTSLAASDSTWHRLTVHLTTGGTPHVDVWLDGNMVDALSKDDTFGGTDIGTVQVGENVAGRSFAGALDNVQIDDSPIAP
jgi:hypothetical protein